MKSQLIGAMCAVLFTFTTMSANAAFFGRLETSPGSGIFQAYYDDQLDITWTEDADIIGQDTWNNQVTWAAGLTINDIGGWRLPNMDINVDGTIVNCSLVTQAECMDNEFGHLFRYGADTTPPGVTAQFRSPFSNLGARVYWSGTEDASNPDDAWHILFNVGGVQNTGSKDGNARAWAVHDGDVGVIPVPAAVWLFGSGLLGLLGIARRKR